MHQTNPPGHIAPHIPADIYQQGQATGQPVVIVVHNRPAAGIEGRRLLVPFAIAAATVAGGWGLVAALCFLLDAVTHTFTVVAGAAGPLGVGGITLKLFNPKR
ncbi:hypothetical protein [Streptomyces sp. NPDC003832]